MPVILATWVIQIKRIVVQGQPGKIETEMLWVLCWTCTYPPTPLVLTTTL
jgi:hypothetical protein